LRGFQRPIIERNVIYENDRGIDANNSEARITNNTIVTSMNTALSMIVKILIKISEVLSIGLVIVGLFLWFSRISPYTGKRLIISAILLFIFAYILKHVYV